MGTFTLKNIAFWISDLSDLTEILPFFFWLLVKSKKEPFVILALYFLCSGTISLYGFLTAEKGIHNLHLYHIWAIVQIVFIYIFYKTLWKEPPVFWFVFLIIAGYFCASIWLQPIESLNSFCWTANDALIIYFGTKHFYKVYQDDSVTTQLSNRPDFLVTTGWLLYAAGSMFAYLMGQDILRGTPEGFFKNAWIFQCVSNIIKTSIFCYAFWLLKKEND